MGRGSVHLSQQSGVVKEKTKQLIKRMIDFGYSDEDIVLRLRRPEELVQAIREQMRLEEIAKHQQPKYDDWDEDYDN